MQIAVVGCGWLGLPLSLVLQKSGHNIVATSRSQSGCDLLSKAGLNAVQFELGNHQLELNIQDVFASELLILNIPVGRKNPSVEGFVKHIERLLQQAAASHIQQVIFISSTSVYGEASRVVTETSEAQPVTQSAQKNLEIEHLVKQYFPAHACILRLAGLVGDKRHPAVHLAGKKTLANPQQVVNLVHQQDVITAIENIIQRKLWSNTLHLRATAHPTRQEYYVWAAETLRLTAPQFTLNVESSTGKTVDANASLRLLDMTLMYPSPYDMLDGMA